MIKFDDIEVFTTRPETINNATFLAVAGKEDRFTGRQVTNPDSGQKIPVWEATYVYDNYGTGAIMGVPAYDERDMAFAKKHKIPAVKLKFTKKILGEKMTTYHIRDWLISRQRYWGPPVPMIYCDDDGWQPVPESDLPVKLPTDVDFLPHGESPIATSKTFQKGVVCPKCGKDALREVDTMDTYVDSSWYFLRFADPKNNKEFASPNALKNWLPVDEYVGGGHVVQHLLFARFIWKVLYDEGLIDKSLGEEPFLKLRAPGWILGSDSRKMSKRWGNVVTPDDIIPKFGADTLRLYEMFIGPFDVMKPWSMSGVEGASRFLGRVWRLFASFDSGSSLLRGPSAASREASAVRSSLHRTIKKVTEDIENYKFNTAISSLMELVNILTEQKTYSKEDLGILARLLAPFAPHMTEQLWVEVLGQPFSIHKAPWPVYEAKYVQVDKVVMVVQVNGKVRAQLTVDSEQSKVQSEIEKIAKNDSQVEKWLDGKKIKKVVFVPEKLINLVV